MTYDDAYLTFWSRVYQDNPVLAERGVSFARFLTAPVGLLEAARAGAPIPAQPDILKEAA